LARSEADPESRASVEPLRCEGAPVHRDEDYFEHLGKWDALLDALRPELRAFLEQGFVTGVVYEALVVPELIAAEASVCGTSVRAYLDARTRWQAKRDLGGIYRVVVRLAPIDVTISRVLMVMTQMFNFGDPIVSMAEPRRLEVEIAGIPKALEAWLRPCVGVYGEECLRMSGKREFRVECLSSARERSVLGHEMVRLRFVCSWGSASSQ